MLKNPENIMKIYEVYVNRLSQEYDLIWNRFKIYAGVNTGLLIVLSFLLNWYHPSSLTQISLELKFLIILLSIIGILFAFFWATINLNGKDWMILMNSILANLENEIFLNSENGLFSKIRKTAKWYDVVNVNIALSTVFLLFWVAILLLFALL
jgi:hypothetical protein